jgi:hypothetical protein
VPCIGSEARPSLATDVLLSSISDIVMPYELDDLFISLVVVPEESHHCAAQTNHFILTWYGPWSLNHFDEQNRNVQELREMFCVLSVVFIQAPKQFKYLWRCEEDIGAFIFVLIVLLMYISKL